MGKTVSDELLTRWLCSDVTATEEAEVLDYLAESDEHLDELLTMSASVQIVDEKKSQPKKRKLFTMAIAIAASFALLFIVTYPFRQNEYTPQMTAAPSYATSDTVNDEQ